MNTNVIGVAKNGLSVNINNWIIVLCETVDTWFYWFDLVVIEEVSMYINSEFDSVSKMNIFPIIMQLSFIRD